MSERSIRVLLVDDHKMVLDSLSMLVSSIDNIQVAGKFTEARKALQFIFQNHVDLVVTDSRMPDMNGHELSRQILAYNPALKIIMVSMIESPDEIKAAMELGISAYLSKSVSADELIVAINRVLDGKKYLSNEIIVSLTSGGPADKMEVSKVAGLTVREREILKLIAKEFSTNEIAEKLFISVPTVETHRKNLFQKTGSKSAIGLVLFAIKHKLLD
jgi:DNA-binding NarL/FixJ family response regulator